MTKPARPWQAWLLQLATWLVLLGGLGWETCATYEPLSRLWVPLLPGDFHRPDLWPRLLDPWLKLLVLAVMVVWWFGIIYAGWRLAREHGLNAGGEARRLRWLSRTLEPVLQADLQPDEQVVRTFATRPAGYDSPVPLLLATAVSAATLYLVLLGYQVPMSYLSVGISDAVITGWWWLAGGLALAAVLLVVSRITHRDAAGHLAVSGWFTLVLICALLRLWGPWCVLTWDDALQQDSLGPALALSPMAAWDECSEAPRVPRLPAVTEPTQFSPALAFWLTLFLWDVWAWRRRARQGWLVVTDRRLLWYTGTLAGLRDANWQRAFAGRARSLSWRSKLHGAEVTLDGGDELLTFHLLRRRDAALLARLAQINAGADGGQRKSVRPRTAALVTTLASALVLVSCLVAGWWAAWTEMGNAYLVIGCWSALHQSEHVADANRSSAWLVAPSKHSVGHTYSPELQRACGEMAIRLRPNLVYAHAMMGEALAEMDQPEASRTAYDWAWALLDVERRGGRKLRDYLLVRRQ